MTIETATETSQNLYSDITALRKLACGANNPDVLWFLSQNQDASVRLNVASNVYAGNEILDSLASDTSEDVRLRVASNPSTSPETLEKLFVEASDAVSVAVASNVNISGELAMKVISSTNVFLRIHLAQNMGLINHPTVAQKLYRDRNKTVIDALEESPAKMLLKLV